MEGAYLLKRKKKTIHTIANPDPSLDPKLVLSLASDLDAT